MPELPEVETTLKAILPHVLQQQVSNVVIRQSQLRWPVPANLAKKLRNQTVLQAKRRAKYLLLEFNTGTLIIHLGMSGRLRILTESVAPAKHDHVDIYFQQVCLRYTDPRRFGAILWTEEAIEQHPLLQAIGPEPLTAAFHAEYLHQEAQRKSLPIKSFIMDSKVVAGVGNIYATEALFQAQIHPETPAQKISLPRYQRLVTAIKQILTQAIAKGGTTLKDFMLPTGTPGYFSIELSVYGRSGEPCLRCHNLLKLIQIAKRSTTYCAYCQKDT